jgi:AcrR family transcriptional regulator
MTTNPSTLASRRPRRRDGEATREKVLQAALDCVLDLGYHESSTNEIARRAGVTWGVIQHQFGTREQLLLAVLDHIWARLQALVRDADITGDTLDDRLRAVLEVLAVHYGDPWHLVELQIGLDLGTNPRTSAETRRAVSRHGARLARMWQPFWAEALGELADERDLVGYTFTTLRGYLVGRLMMRRFGRVQSDATERRLLVEGVAASLRGEARRRGLAVPT